MRNVYFDLTREFNARGRIAILTSGQAAVFYRTAIMSKDGDWILAESAEACERILEVLAAHNARYRPGAPLDIRWLGGGWSSHFEFPDEAGRRIRCDFMTRPPRLDAAVARGYFDGPAEPGRLEVVGLEDLILMKRTQRLKDYAVIGELARLLPPEREILFTTDPDRILELVPAHGADVARLPVQVARTEATREDVAIALTRETLALQEADAHRLRVYQRAGKAYLEHLRASGITGLPLAEAHPRMLRLAEEWLPPHPPPPAEEATRGTPE
ncbi:MAG: hypothetical protein MUE73_17940 [Planctomycetes bacterium]|jgi:hypothetical protein|nr:hypothetical protein [Planctomycetota bacterium]